MVMRTIFAGAPHLLAAMSALLLGCSDNIAPPGDGTRVGALLPFTGGLSSSGANLEKALIMAAESVDEGGGAGGRAIVLEVADSRSSNTLGMNAMRDLLDRGVIGIVGPEEEDLAKLMAPVMTDEEKLLLSPGISLPSETAASSDGFWVRVAPSSLIFGRALAGRMYQDGIRRAAIIHVNDEYGSGFSSVVAAEFRDLGGEITAVESLLGGQADYSEELAAVLDGDPEAAVLVTYPSMGAIVVESVLGLQSSLEWYLAPTLKTEVLLANIPFGALEGSVGVAPAPSADAPEFEQAFAARWFGDRPLDHAYSYFDGLALLALAIEHAARSSGDAPTTREVALALQEVSGPPGEVIHWNELDVGLGRVAEGVDINYEGISGSVDVNEDGEVTDANVQFWGVSEGMIQDE